MKNYLKEFSFNISGDGKHNNLINQREDIYKYIHTLMIKNFKIITSHKNIIMILTIKIQL